MMMFTRHVVLVGIALCSLATVSRADTLHAHLTFERILPFVGVLYVPDAAAELPPKALLDQKNKQFSAPVVVVAPRSELKIKNSDEFEHNIFADDRQTNIAFDLGTIVPRGNFRLPVRWKQDSLLRLGCKIHPKMKAYVANIQASRYATIAFEPGKMDYEVVLDKVPAAKAEVRLLLPELPPLVMSLKAGQSKLLPVIVQGRELGKVEVKRVAD